MVLSIFSSCTDGGGGDSGAGPATGALDESPSQDVFRPGDVMIVRVSGVGESDEGTYEAQVDESGSITMPYLGSVKAEGVTAVVLKERIETLYRMKGIYNNPNITILTQERRTVSVLGEVRAQARIAYSKDLTLMSAIATCGGFSEYANKRAIELHRGGRVSIFDANAIRKNPASDPKLRPDDRIHIRRSIF